MVVKGQAHPMMDAAYKILMRRNSVYIAFVLGGALLGERVVNGAMDAMWDKNNAGKLYKHLEGSVIGAGGGGENAEE